MSILVNKKTRLNPFTRMLAVALIAGGVVAFRWDTNLIGQLVMVSYLPGEAIVSYTMYRPSLIEWMAGLGIIAYGLTLFSLGVRYLHVVDHNIYNQEAVHEIAHETAHETAPAGQTLPV